MSFGFYTDQNLTTQVNMNNPIMLSFNTAGGGATVDFVVYFGSPDATKKVVPVAPDTTISVEIFDSDTGNAHTLNATNGPWYVLATTEADLNTRPKNTPLEIGTQVLGGVSNRVAIYVRIYEPEQAPAIWEDFILRTNPLQVQNV